MLRVCECSRLMVAVVWLAGGCVCACQQEDDNAGRIVPGAEGHASMTAAGESLSKNDSASSGCSTEAKLDGNRCFLADGQLGVCISARGGCVPSACGDGFVAKIFDEQCDDANDFAETCPYGTKACTVCDSDCKQKKGVGSYCGDGVVERENGESCDDGNSEAKDGCAPTCLVEAGWSCDAHQPSYCAPGAMVSIEAAGKTVTLGSPESELGRSRDESQHRVKFTCNFAISSTETTQGEFAAVMHWNPSYFGPGADYPQEEVSWFDAAAYANQLTLKHGGKPCYLFSNTECVDTTSAGSDYMACMTPRQRGVNSADVELNEVKSVYDCTGFRLPTEAEWEYAARAETSTATYNGDLEQNNQECDNNDAILNPIAWFCGNAGETPHIVGDRESNAWGLFDMLGNVWEWCHDRYAEYPPGSLTDPAGPDAGPYRIFRGGSWRDPAREIRTAYRNNTGPGYRHRTLGFRVARSLP